MIREFRDFLLKANALAVAIGFIIAAATGKVVSSLVDNVMMPAIAVVMPPGDWREAQIELSRGKDANGKVTVNAIQYGHFVGAIVDFVIISGVVFVITKTLLPQEKAPDTKTCSECLETVAKAARRCKFCTAPVA
ncbi:MAG: large conductance mechanosensitive channel protein MscL [Candidatus Melainabacteria bacterium]|jgi:large conductance mechanosensitive channel|nr:large conductance mechanosensitive channel protein MscL [Candidatus Melainabacteria bacterium]